VDDVTSGIGFSISAQVTGPEVPMLKANFLTEVSSGN